MKKKILFLVLAFTILFIDLTAEDGYRLWLRYDRITNTQQLAQYNQLIKGLIIEGESPVLTSARNELQTGIKGLLGREIALFKTLTSDGMIVAGTPSSSPLINALKLTDKLKNLGDEGFLILTTTVNKKKTIIISANSHVGVLYGVFHFLRTLQTNQDISNLSLESAPRIQRRILNHWDNLDRTVERGYAGFSLWDWHKLPDYLDPRYVDYARANASVGINGTVLTNVNANALIITPDYLKKVKALADIFRNYGIRVYLTARFSAPIEIGGLKTADPLDKDVQQWWKNTVDEIYNVVPDFGGFLVKANSEGQPGPQNYGRTHADGANMLADALQPHNGIVMWRAFVYDNNVPDDRAKQAYNEFKPLDGTFRKNVIIQVKNGAIDFQPREPFHPLFGAMPKTPLMMEFQLTQEYLGFSTHLVYLPTLFKECLDSDTYAKGEGSTVAKVVDGTLDNHPISAIAGVANIGNDRNWCGHHFAQSNWYGFGRLAWDHQLTSEQIAEEWTRMTFTNDADFVTPVKEMMLNSREITVNYMTPLGLHHIMGWSHHYGPSPWIKDKQRADWTSVYYHRADTFGVGFNRTASGSNAISQYAPQVQKIFSSTELCPEKYLLWFHHVSWDYKTKSGNKLWDELCYHYYNGATAVKGMQNTWNSLEKKVDADRFSHVKSHLAIQEKEARWWRDACVLYFQTFSKRPIPATLTKPDRSLETIQKLIYPYAPGIRPGW
jgi:alpha-glucuronidase